MKDLTIIVVNYNTSQLVLNSISSFADSLDSVRYEYIIVDNGSKASSRSDLKKLLSKVKNLSIIENRENLGFGRANNLALNKSKGRYVLFLNSDTLASDINFNEIISWLDENQEIGAMTCTLKNQDGSIQGTGGYFPTLIRVFFWIFFIDDIPFIDSLVRPFHPHRPKSLLKNDSFYKSIREIDWITGAFFLGRKEALGTGFDKDFFMYGEDVELSKRVKDCGFSIVYNPKWSIIHLGGKSSSGSFPIISEFEGVKLYYKKHMPSYQLPVLRFVLFLGVLFRRIVFYILGNNTLVQTYGEAIRKI